MTPVIAKAVEKVIGHSFDPKHPNNASNADWQAGYFEGKLIENYDTLAEIAKEWERRGCPEREGAALNSFHSWTRGFWAGIYSRL